jgi:hypothetical protein
MPSLKLEVIFSSETLVPVQTMRQYIAEGGNIQYDHYENLKFNTLYYFFPC